MHAALELLARQFGELALYLIDPGSRGGRELNMPMRAAREPRLDRGRFMCGVVIHHEMNIQVIRHLSVDTFQEVEKFRGTMTFVAFADYRTCCDVEGCKQRRRTVPEIGMGTSFRHARYHGQDWLFAVQRLDLGFLVDAQHDRAVRWRHVKTDNIPNLVDK